MSLLRWLSFPDINSYRCCEFERPLSQLPCRDFEQVVYSKLLGIIDVLSYGHVCISELLKEGNIKCSCFHSEEVILTLILHQNSETFDFACLYVILD